VRIVVTDLTRFRKKDILCLAGLTEDGQQCIRPLRRTAPGYLSYKACQERNILPGTILEATFTPPPKLDAPHIEDRYFDQLNVVGSVNSEQFRSILEASSNTSIREGLGCKDATLTKVLKYAPARSIMTLRVAPENFEVVHDMHDTEKIKAHLIDGDEVSLRFLPITDLGFYDNIGRTATRKVSAGDITKFIRAQDALFIRLGLSRKYASEDGRNGFWIQVNGIYTFPAYDHVVRSY
jgi:Dual OB-containing domain